MNPRGPSISRAAAAACILILSLLVGQAAPAAGRGEPDLGPILQELEDYALQLRGEQGVPGMAYAVVKGDQIVYARGFGYRDQLPSSGLVDEHTLFEIGSTTKAFNAAAVGTVVDEGKAAWSDRVRDHLPDFKMQDPWVTREFLVEDLMAQRSGMPPYSLDAMSLLGFDRKDIMRAVRFVEPVSSFRARFGYQNDLHLWAAELVQKKTGLAWEEAVRRRILEPLGMSESTFDFAAFDANPNHTMGHIVVGELLWTIPPDWPYRGWLTVYGPAGGLMSSASDMAKWVALQIGDGAAGGRVILRPETMAAIRAPRIYRSTDSHGVSSYAMGWAFQSSPQTPWYLHDGETAGMHSIVAVYPEGQLGLAVLTNHPGNTIPEKLAVRLLELYFGGPATGGGGAPCPMDRFQGRDAGMPRPPAVPDTAAALPPGKLAGTYENPAYGKAVVRKEPGGLSISLGPAKVHGMLTPTGGNTYSFAWPDWPGQFSTVTFKADAAGAVSKLTIVECADVRGGDFKKTNP
jgi:CubicO group peptidase (beta-lactamase class C family)